MGAEQSALLACTQTSIHEDRVEMVNSKLFFQLYFDRMPQPVTGPVTEALLHLVKKVNAAGAINADENQSTMDECNSGESDTISELSDRSEVSTASSDVKIEPIQIAEFEPIEQYNMSIEETHNTYTLPLFK
ncbi:uncharacterized protein LOC6611265 [Drosophila sechellia]|uniref:GD23960 n=2 Tax=melanogaster subgroup TaxID=32351 RepID=B4Q5I8_DROSI|nr:uncharacterized protein LOC6611265 [Drosophila sechellia]XP_002079447.1 uncharacterized protein LOC6732319 [Drosophila simulans]EDW51743.1 GM15549 [Drosophila sechellia]EDX05032.1 GD23960 [Drosophila simulans]KMY90240.1 uncharacterized protein Dsimw501_GD23960 [Drosophila simulans]